VQKDREVPDTYQPTIEYANFYITLSSSMANAAATKYYPEVIYGHKGTILFERDAVVVVPEEPGRRAARDAAPPQPKRYAVERGETGRAHTDNFLACMRSRNQPALNPELGCQIMTAIKLGVDSYREGKVKFFDPRTERVMDRGPARPGYEGRAGSARLQRCTTTTMVRGTRSGSSPTRSWMSRRSGRSRWNGSAA
jgi:hypothetical protein